MPARRMGIIVQASACLVLLGASAADFSLALRSEVGAVFLLYLLFALAILAPLPIVAYRLYALLGARYILDRDGLRLKWGLRSEDLPLGEIEWIRPAAEVTALIPSAPRHLPLPWLHWPGALVGRRQVSSLGPVEFLATGPERLLLVATPQRVFAISPADPKSFLAAFNRITELGSLTPLHHHSTYPAALVGRLWDNRWARGLLLAGLGAGLILLIWVSLAIPGRPSVSLGFTPAGLPVNSSPSARLMLLPVLNGFIYLGDLTAGLYFYRRLTQRPVAYLLWAAGALTGVLMLVAVAFIL